MRRSRSVLLSTYELGHQPLGLAAPAAALRAAGHDIACFDLALESFPQGAIEAADFVGISVPMHTAARLGVAVARRVRAVNPAAHIAFYGLYAASLADILTSSGIADSVLGGEFEPGLVALADDLSRNDRPAARTTSFTRQEYALPDRNGLPPLAQYARLRIGDELRLAGYVEASRGCAHTCTHCPITPVYGGRLRVVQPEPVLADIDQQVELGARHITFGDPDFFNATSHSLAIVDEMRRRHPDVTFDATIKVEHLVEHEAALPRLRDAGCLFITSAFESTNDLILARLQKGHTCADMERVLAFAGRENLVIRPTWVAFTPWTTADNYLDLLSFVEEHALIGNVQPVQFSLRLLLPLGSPLVPVLAGEGGLGSFDSEALTYAWTSPDARMDPLQHDVSAIVEAAATTADCGCAEPIGVTFRKVKEAAFRALAGRQPPDAPTRPIRSIPGLTESWFC